MRILLADDQEDIRLLAKQHLEKHGHSLVSVSNGEDVLLELRRQSFDLVLLDEEMPGMKGTEVLHAIRRAEKEFQALTVIALTGYNTESEEARLLQSGFDAVLGKPFRFEVLESAMQAAIKNKSSRVPKSVTLVASPVSGDDALARLAGNEELLRDLARLFLKDLPARLAKLQKSIQKKRGDTLAFDAHALKGSLAIFGAQHAIALCNALQEQGKEARYAEAAETFVDLKEAIAELEPNLRGYAEQKRTTAPGAPPPAKTKSRPRDSK